MFEEYASQKPERWSCDSRTRDLICIGNWLSEQFAEAHLDDVGRRAQEWQFNRRSRSEEDLFALAAEIMNDTEAGKIDRDRIPLRRWGL